MNHFVCMLNDLSIRFHCKKNSLFRNMSKNLTFWYSNFIPRFQSIKSNSSSLEVIRIGAR